ncbi:MAG: cystathionine gamma-synthase family protein, partial [Geminicoccaceae bacterium]
MLDHVYRRTQLQEHDLHPSTQMMSYGYDPFMSEGAVKPPVFLTSTFAFRTAEEGADFFDVVAGRKPAPEGESAGLVYSRFNHPNLEIVEDRLALLDGAEAAAVTSSGMAAISAVFLAFLQPGDVIVHSTPLYGGTETLIRKNLANLGIKAVPFVDGLDADDIANALDRAATLGPVKIFYIEAPANPTNALIDFAIVQRALDTFEQTHGYRPISICDNTMLGPIFQRPIEHGINLCIYSLTKYIGGHSDLVAGGVTGTRDLLQKIRLTRSAFGSQLDPHSSWMIARSMETLFMRMERAAESGRKVAAWLVSNPHLPARVLHNEHDPNPVSRAVYDRQCTGPGSTFSFVIDGDRATAFRIVNALQLFKLAVSLGGTESLVCHPASTTHSGVPT